MRLLIVDDEPAVLRCLERALKRYYEVTTAQSGAAALILMAKRHYDAILADVDMPGMTGDQLIAALSPERASRVVLMSGGFHDESTRPFLAKPLTVATLISAIDATIVGPELSVT